jgi:class 3 adenylate cyclase
MILIKVEDNLSNESNNETTKDIDEQYSYAENNNLNSEDNNQISFINYTQSYCVCIVDIINSTIYTSEIALPEKIRKYYSIFLNSLGAIIKRFGGKVIKTIGDSLFYYFPKTSDSTNALGFQDVLECGMAMINAKDNMNEQLLKEKLPPIRYRISADYGKVEIAKSSSSNSVDLFGSTVNICSKINHFASPNKLVIGQNLYQMIEKFSFTKEYSFSPLLVKQEILI